MAENSIKDLQDYFGVDAKEMRELWMSLTDEEKVEFKKADLTS
jgi:hypothetical protein